jgi:hypothetical protein
MAPSFRVPLAADVVASATFLPPITGIKLAGTTAGTTAAGAPTTAAVTAAPLAAVAAAPVVLGALSAGSPPDTPAKTGRGAAKIARIGANDATGWAGAAALTGSLNCTAWCTASTIARCNTGSTVSSSVGAPAAAACSVPGVNATELPHCKQKSSPSTGNNFAWHTGHFIVFLFGQLVTLF